MSLLHRLLDKSMVFSFDRTGFARHARGFDDEPERILQGRSILMTGGTAGIGEAAARAFVERGAEVTVWARNPERGRRAAAEIGANFTAVDLGELPAVAEAAASFEGPELAAVVLCAGAMPLERTLTGQDHELVWGSQVLGHLLLLRVLEARGRLTPETRVVWVSSGGMYAQRLDLRDLRRDQGYARHTVYANAKRAQVVLAEHLATLWPSVPMTTMHPGWVQTDAVKHSMPVFHALTRPILRTPAEGADTIVWLVARDPTPAQGKFWFDREARPTHLRQGTKAPASDRSALIRTVFEDTDPYMEPGTQTSPLHAR